MNGEKGWLEVNYSLQALERENNPQKKFWDQLGFEPKTEL